MSIQTYLKTEFDKNPWTDETSHLHKLIIGSFSFYLIVAASEFLLKKPFEIFDTVHSEIRHFKLVESIKSDGGNIIEKDGRKIAMFPCFDEKSDFYIIPDAPECRNEAGGYNRKAFYHFKHYDDLLNGAIQ